MTQWTTQRVYEAQQAAMQAEPALRPGRPPRCKCGGNIRNGKCMRGGGKPQ